MAKRKSDPAETIQAEVKTPTHRTPSIPIWESNPKLVMYVLGAVVLAVVGWILYKNLIVNPQQKEALSAMWQAEQQFDRDSFQLALENPGGGFEGFAALADKYSSTKAGNLCNYYAAVCNLHTGNFDGVIQYMDKFDAEGEVLPAMKYGILGDAYSEKQDFSKALSYYEKAADATKVDVVAIYYLKKLGMLNEHEGKKDAALKAYERIQRDYPNPSLADWRDIEKYIVRVKPEN